MESTTSKVQVAESGNKRKEVSEEDLNQAVNDIKGWFQQNHADFFDKVFKEAPSIAGSKEDAQKFLAQNEGHSKSLALLVVLSKCPVKFQFLDTFRLLPLSDINVVTCESH